MELDDIKDLKWDTIKVEDMAEIPNCFSDWDCAAASHLQWPAVSLSACVQFVVQKLGCHQGRCWIAIPVPPQD